MLRQIKRGEHAGMWTISEPMSKAAIYDSMLDMLETENYVAITGARDAQDYCKVKLGKLEREVLAVIFLDGQNNVIEFNIMFQGTINQASVYPREIIKRAFELNAASLMLAHNHPSGDPTPSQADRAITERVKQAAGLIDMQLIDHIIVGGLKTYSFAEHGSI